MGDTASQFASLFAGSWDAYGTEEGGCDRDTSTANYHDRILMHLAGTRPMGVYPMHVLNHEWVVNWGCIDFDEGEEASLAYARNVHAVLREFGITAWVERSRSKGYHVWVFLDEPVEASIVRTALLGACQVVGAPTKEINPKQTSLSEGQLGNYVRLPYPGATAEDNPFPPDRRTMIVPTDGGSMPLQWFVEHAWQGLATLPQLEALTALYVEPPKPVFIPTQTFAADQDMHRRMSGLAYTIWKDGPIGDGDRSDTLWKFARLLAEGGKHMPGEAVELVREADLTWGKFHERPNGDDLVNKLVSKAYGL